MRRRKLAWVAAIGAATLAIAGCTAAAPQSAPTVSHSTSSRRGSSIPQNPVTITTGDQPTGTAYDPLTKSIFVTNSGSNTVSVISSKTNKITKTIRVGGNPSAIIYDPATKQIYVSNQGDSTISKIDAETGTNLGLMPRIEKYGDPLFADAFLYDSAQKTIFASTNAYEIYAIASRGDPDSAPTKVASAPSQSQFTYSDATDEFYVSNTVDNNVLAVDAVTGKTAAAISVGEKPGPIAYDPDTREIYVADQQDGLIYTIDTSTHKVTSRFPTAGKMAEIQALTYDLHNKRMYAFGLNYVIIINPADGNSTEATGVLKGAPTVPGNMFFNGVTFDPANHCFYAPLQGSLSKVAVIPEAVIKKQ